MVRVPPAPPSAPSASSRLQRSHGHNGRRRGRRRARRAFPGETQQCNSFVLLVDCMGSYPRMCSLRDVLCPLSSPSLLRYCCTRRELAVAVRYPTTPPSDNTKLARESPDMTSCVSCCMVTPIEICTITTLRAHRLFRACELFRIQGVNTRHIRSIRQNPQRSSSLLQLLCKKDFSAKLQVF